VVWGHVGSGAAGVGTHRLQIVELGQRPFLSAALCAKDQAAVPAVVLPDDQRKLAAASAAL